MTTATTMAIVSFADLPPIMNKEVAVLVEADVVAAPVFAVEDGVRGTYVLVGSEVDAEVVDGSEVRVDDPVAPTLPHIRFEYTDAGSRVCMRHLSLPSISHRDPRYNMSALQRQLLRSENVLLYAELHEVIDTVRLSQSTATSSQNSRSNTVGLVTIMVLGEYVNASSCEHMVDQV